MRVVVDTNVWVSGLIAPNGPPGRIVRAVRDGRVQAIATWALANEIVDTLRRPKLRRYEIGERDVEEVLILLAPLLPDVEVDVELRDPSDSPVVGAAVGARAEAIVTGDADLLDAADVRAWLLERDIAVLAPAELLKRLSG